jgi:hypothetical protein
MRWWWQPPALLRPVVVNLKNLKDDESAIQGVLWGMRGPWLIIRQPTLVRRERPDAITVDGEVLIHRDNVSFIQVVP